MSSINLISISISTNEEVDTPMLQNLQLNMWCEEEENVTNIQLIFVQYLQETFLIAN